MSDPEHCPELVHGDWHSSVCGRPVKRDGLCGIHARAKETRDATAARWQVRAAAAEAWRADTKARLAAIGVTEFSTIAPDDGREGQVILDLSVVEALAAQTLTAKGPE